MLNDILLSFFFGMPAIVAIFLARDMRSPLARAMLFWGGIAATVAVAMVLVPMLLCDGTITSDYTSCLGGAALRPGCGACLLYTSPSPRDQRGSRMPSSA